MKTAAAMTTRPSNTPAAMAHTAFRFVAHHMNTDARTTQPHAAMSMIAINIV